MTSHLDVALDQPPVHSIEAEHDVIGAIFWNAHAFYRVITIIDVEDFYRDAHRVIFSAIKRLAEASQPIDLLTVKEELGRRGQLDQAGGAAYVSSLTDGIPDIANVESYAHIVKEQATLRRLALLGSRIVTAAHEAPRDAGEVLALAEQGIYGIAERSVDRGFVSLDKLTRANMLAIEQLQSAGRLITGVPTGYDRFNEFTGGFQKSDLVIIAARPSMGKTALACNVAEAIAIPTSAGGGARQDRLYAVALFSLEMSKEQVGLRVLSSESGVPHHLIRAGMLSERNWRDLAAAAARVAKGRIWIDDTAGIDIMELRAKARRLSREVELDLVMVDYLQLMSVKGRTESRQQEVSTISRGLKAVAKELAVPVVALSQLSRRPEQRTGDHRPQLADLRESGAIEQDADLVCFIYRDEVYHPDSEEKGIAEIIIGKQRNGPIGDFKLVFRNDLTKFFNYEPSTDWTPAETERLTREQQRSIQ